jgi:hypothetical protein
MLLSVKELSGKFIPKRTRLEEISREEYLNFLEGFNLNENDLTVSIEEFQKEIERVLQTKGSIDNYFNKTKLFGLENTFPDRFNLRRYPQISAVSLLSPDSLCSLVSGLGGNRRVYGSNFSVTLIQSESNIEKNTLKHVLHSSEDTLKIRYIPLPFPRIQ